MSPSGEDDRRPAGDPTTPLPARGSRAALHADDATTPLRPGGRPGASGSAGGEGLPGFAPDEIVADRYQVVRFIARGGMGEVYEVRDLELGERVALKTIRTDAAAGAEALERFRREVLLARKVTHPNVCRIFEFGHHVGAGGRPVLFLTMELLAGESLADRISRGGRLPVADALPIAQQLVQALAAAHEAGVVHRDFKSANVLLVPSPGGGERAVVTDFGLARGVAGGTDLESTLSGGFVGTPAYMSPEQLDGGKVGPASDLYSFGIVLYEMVTGKRPFSGATPVSIALKRLTSTPDPPRRWVEDLDPRWERTILRCLAREPNDRFPDAVAVGRALEEGVKGARRFPGRKALLLGSALLLAGLLGSGGWWLLRRQGGPSGGAGPASAGAVAPRRSFAVIGFKNLRGGSGEEWVSTALGEWLSSELAAGERLRSVAGESVSRAKRELKLEEADGYAADTLGRIRKSLGADLVVVGSFLFTGSGDDARVRVDVRMQDTATGETVAAVGEGGRGSELPELVGRVGARLRETLGAGALAGDRLAAARAVLPSSPEALRLYAEGLARLRRLDAAGAIGPLERAVAADPSHAPSHSALGVAWQLLGYDSRAVAEAKRAFELAAPLAREARLAIEGRFREAEKNWPAAAEISARLASLAPDDLDYGLALATNLRAAKKVAAARGEIERLRKLPPPLRDDPRIELADAELASATGDHARSRERAQRAIAAAADREMPSVAARGHLVLASAARNQGDLDGAVAEAGEARRFYEAAGDRGSAARATISIAGTLYLAGKIEEARAGFARVLPIAREIGDKGGEARAETGLAIAAAEGGNLPGARAGFERALALQREIGEHRGALRNLVNLAVAEGTEGDFAPAFRSLDEALTRARELSDDSSIADTLAEKGSLLEQTGDFSGARGAFAEALALREKREEAASVAKTRLALASLALTEAEGDPPRLAAAAAKAEETGRALEASTDSRLKSRALTILSSRLRAVAMATLGRRAEARRLLAAAPAPEGIDERLALELDRIRIETVGAGAPLPAELAGRVSSLLADAKGSGRIGVVLEARRLASLLELRGGAKGGAAPRERLLELAKEAEGRGFRLTATRARRDAGR
jgi:tetratricopeptide (TPR) repeat protein/TolB-like protein